MTDINQQPAGKKLESTKFDSNTTTEQFKKYLQTQKRGMSLDASLRNISKHDQIRTIMIREMKNVYKTPEAAFSDMDFNGKGVVFEQDFFKTLLIYRLPFSTEEISEFFVKEKNFKQRADGGMDFELFKKIFFPNRESNGAGNANAATDDRIAKQNADELLGFQDDKRSSQVVAERIKLIEAAIRTKFCNNWTSVRKAFLDVDQDYDGFITAEDIAKFYGANADFKDIQTLLKNRDSKRIGTIDFKDFCKWMGTAIEPCEGFYFRHDSVKNPQYENNVRKQIEQNAKSVQIVTDKLINTNLMKTVLEKFQNQWKTIKKAFSDLNKGKTGAINPDELRSYLNHWGLAITEEQFREIFNFIDFDKDGKITYEDLQNSVGKFISPEEFLYFRQDIPPAKLRTCKMEACWNVTKGMGTYCPLHYTILKNKAEQILLIKLPQQLKNDKYLQFLQQVKQRSNLSKNQIQLVQLEDILAQLGVSLGDKELKLMIDAYHTKVDQPKDQIMVGVEKLVEQDKTQHLKKIYDGVNLEAQEDEEDEENYKDFDAIQQFGGVLKAATKLDSITDEQLFSIISRDNKLAYIVRDIKKIDKDNNGYVLSIELNKIFKTYYSKELEGKTLTKIFRPYSSIQNKQLIDYKKFNLYMIQKLKTKEADGYNSVQDNLQRDAQELQMSPSSPITNKRVGQIAQYFQNQVDLQIENSRNSAVKKSFTDIQGANPLVNGAKIQLQRNNIDFGGKGYATTRLSIDNLRESEKTAPKTSDSPKMARQKLKRENSLSPSPSSKDSGSLFGGKSSSGFESYRANVPSIGPLDIIKQRLAYEWKNIYRALIQIDINNNGKVSSQEFQNAVSKNRVYMTREEFKKIQAIFGEEDLINYNQLSQQLGLHKNSLDFVQGSKSKNMQVAAQKLKALHITHNGQFMLEPIKKPPMTERNDLMNGGGLNKSASVKVLFKGNQKQFGSAAINQNKGLIMKMVKNFDIDQTGLVSTVNLSKVFKLLGMNYENKNLDTYKSGDMIRYEKFVDDFCQ